MSEEEEDIRLKGITRLQSVFAKSNLNQEIFNVTFKTLTCFPKVLIDSIVLYTHPYIELSFSEYREDLVIQFMEQNLVLFRCRDLWEAERNQLIYSSKSVLQAENFGKYAALVKPIACDPLLAIVWELDDIMPREIKFNLCKLQSQPHFLALHHRYHTSCFSFRFAEAKEELLIALHMISVYLKYFPRRLCL
jgi:hypothetical protein